MKKELKLDFVVNGCKRLKAPVAIYQACIKVDDQNHDSLNLVLVWSCYASLIPPFLVWTPFMPSDKPNTAWCKKHWNKVGLSFFDRLVWVSALSMYLCENLIYNIFFYFLDRVSWIRSFQWWQFQHHGGGFLLLNSRATTWAKLYSESESS